MEVTPIDTRIGIYSFTCPRTARAGSLGSAGASSASAAVIVLFLLSFRE